MRRARSGSAGTPAAAYPPRPSSRWSPSLSLIFLPLTALARFCRRHAVRVVGCAAVARRRRRRRPPALLAPLAPLAVPSRLPRPFFRFFLLPSFFRFFDPFRSLSLEPSRSFRFLDDFCPGIPSRSSRRNCCSSPIVPSASPIAEGGRPTAASRSRCAASGSFAAASGFDPSTIHRLFGSESSIFGPKCCAGEGRRRTAPRSPSPSPLDDGRRPCPRSC